MSITPVTPAVEMQIDGVWTDITEDVRLDSAHSGGGIEITRGVPNEGNAAEPTQVSFVLNNKDGKYSPKNPYSDNYGKIGRNTPVRFALTRRVDDFDRTDTGSWGRLPSWVDTEGTTHLGERWELTGASSRVSMAPGQAKIQSASGLCMLTFGTYADVEIKTKVKCSTRDTEFGVAMRLKRTSVLPGTGDFEGGLSGWLPSGGSSTLAVSTAQSRSGSSSALLTVAGSPTTAYSRSADVPVSGARTYRARAWVRCSVARSITVAIDWKDAGGSTVSTSTSSVSVAANTWTAIETTAVSPDTAVFAAFGPTMGSSPADGTLLYIDDVDLQDYTNLSYYTAYITPATNDQLRLAKVSPGVAESVFSSQDTNFVAGEWWWFRAQISGIRRRVKYWKDGDPEPATWNWRTYEIAATDEISNPPPTGQVGLFASGGTGLVTFGYLEVNVWRAHAEIAQLPPKWDLSRQDRWVPVQATGILRRLGQGRKALESPVALHLANYTTSRMWFPLESVDSTSAIVGNRADNGPHGSVRGLAQGTPDETGEFTLPGVTGVAVFDADDSYLVGKATSGASPGAWSLLCFFRVPAVVASDILLYQVECSGTARRYLIYLLSSGAMRVEARDSDNTILSQNTGLIYFGPHPVGCWFAVNLYVATSGGTTGWALNFHRPGNSDVSFYSLNNTHAGTAGAFREVRFFGSPVLTAAGKLSLAHVFHYPGDLPFVSTAFARAAYAYIGEEAITRFLRLAANAGITATTTGFTSESKAMGAQTPAKLLDLWGECAEVDDSIIMEERDDFGLNMRTRESMWNQIPTLLDIDAGHLSDPLDPALDDQRTRNDVTVKRPNGSFARSVQYEGPLNVNPPETDVDGVGVYDESPEINFQDDSQLISAANWRRSKGTIDDPRYPSIKADLNSSAYDADPAFTAELLAKDSGDMLSILNPEVEYNPVLQRIQGYTETIDQYDYALTFVGHPGAPWRVGTVGKSTRLATRYQFLDADFEAGTDTLLASSRVLPGALWVQVADSPESFPFEIEIEGSRLRVRSTGNVLNFNGHLDTGISGWTASNASLYWDQQYGKFKSGVGSLRMTATSSTTAGAIQSAANQAAVFAGVDYQISAWMMSNVVLADVRMAVDWYQADGTTFISTSTPTAIATGVSTWVHYAATVTAPALAAFARIRPRAVLATGNILWADDMRLMPVSSFSGSLQYLTVDQVPTNGVVKTLHDGAPISVVDPWRVAF